MSRDERWDERADFADLLSAERAVQRPAER